MYIFLVLSCLVLSCLVLSCLVLSCLVLSCLVLSCLVLSCLVFSFLFFSFLHPFMLQVNNNFQMHQRYLRAGNHHFQLACFHIARSKHFGTLTILVICANAIVSASEHYGQSIKFYLIIYIVVFNF